jgi:hypothetical protein
VSFLAPCQHSLDLLDVDRWKPRVLAKRSRPGNTWLNGLLESDTWGYVSRQNFHVITLAITLHPLPRGRGRCDSSAV